jgi:hypothetical protein
MKRTLSTAIEVFGKELTGRCDTLLREVVVQVIDELHGPDIPVDSGWTRASFRVSVNQPDTRPYGRRPPRTKVYKKGVNVGSTGAPKEPPHVAVPHMQFGDTVYISNGVPYYKFIHSQPDIRHVVKMIMQRAVRGVAKIAKRLNK